MKSRITCLFMIAIKLFVTLKKQRIFFKNKVFHLIFEKQVKKTPNNIAVEFESNSLTYAELNQKANCLAHFMQNHGIKKGTLVVVFAERNINFLIGMLAIMKLGAVYIPLDPTDPLQGIINVFLQSNAETILLDEKYSSIFENKLKNIMYSQNMTIILLETGINSKYSGTNLDISYNSSHQAYIINNIIVNHRGMLNLLYMRIKTLKFNETDCIAQNASQNFYISLWQFFMPLIVGGKVRIYTDQVAQDSYKLINAVKHDNVNILELVPFLLKGMFNEVEIQQSHEVNHIKRLRWLLRNRFAIPMVIRSN